MSSGMGMGLGLTPPPKTGSGGAGTLGQIDSVLYATNIANKGGTITTGDRTLIATFLDAYYGEIGGRADCWLMQSRLNVGSGVQFFSVLGEMGTLTTGSVWTANGLRRPNGTTGIIIMPASNAGVTDLVGTMLVIGKFDGGNSFSSATFLSNSDNAIYDSGAFTLNVVYTSAAYFTAKYRGVFDSNTNQGINIVLGQFYAVAATLRNTVDAGIPYLTRQIVHLDEINSAQATGAPGAGKSYSTMFMDASGTNNWDMTAALVINIPQFLTSTQINNIVAAWENTIGAGISLSSGRTDAEAHAANIASKGGTIMTAGDKISLAAFLDGFYTQAGGRRDCWVLQNRFNMGTGTKVYSIFGVEGTLVGGAAWGPNGIVSMLNQQITIPGSTISSNTITAITVQSVSNPSSEAITILLHSTTGGDHWTALRAPKSGGGLNFTATYPEGTNISTSVSVGIVANEFFVALGRCNASGGQVYKDLTLNGIDGSASMAARTYSDGLIALENGAGTLTQSFATIADGSYIDPSMFYSIYKATIGADILLT